MIDARLNAALADSPFHAQAAFVHGVARPSVRLLPDDHESPQLGAHPSRLGGDPDLPAGSDWPTWEFEGERRALSFVCQVDLGSLPKAAMPRELPKDGLLSFFYDATTMPSGLEGEEGGARVLYFPADTALETTPAPDGDDAPRRFQAVPLRGHPESTLPDVFLPPDLDPVDIGMTDEQVGEAEEDLRENCRMEPAPLHRIGGFDDPVQWPKVGIDDADDVVLLLQLDSDGGAGWMWADAGTVYFLIDRADLAAGRFDQAGYQMESC